MNYNKGVCAIIHKTGGLVLKKILSVIKSKRLYIAAFFIPAVILFAAYACFGVYPFGDNSVLVLDLNGQYVYYFEHLRNVLHFEGSPFISWSRNLSGETMGIFAYYLASPFTLIVMLLPRSIITESLLIMQLCKVGAASVTFCWYQKHARDNHNAASLIFSICYSLMSYMIVQLMNPMWLDGLIYLPLICYGIEVLIDKGKMLWFVIPLALMFMANFYIGWMTAFFSVLYFLYYFLFIRREKEAALYYFIARGFKFAVCGVTAALASAWVLLPLYNSLKLGKLDFTDPKFEWKTQFEILDFFANLMPNSYDTVRPEGSPVLFCGCLTLILVPLFFLNSKIDAKRKIGSAFLLYFLMMSMYISNIDIAWHGFQVPNWLPYRYSFTFSFVLLLMAAETFEHIDGISAKQIGGTFFGLFVYIICLNKNDADNRLDIIYSIWFAIGCIAIYAIVLYLHKKFYKSGGTALALVILVCAELFGTTLWNLDAINKDVVYSKHSSYNDYITLGRDTVHDIYEMDGGTYRIESDYHRTTNDALAFGSYGISHSSSTLNAGPIQLLRRLGFSYGGHYIKYKGETYVTDSILGIKYVMERGAKNSAGVVDKEPVCKQYNDLVMTRESEKNKIWVYENPYALPIGFMANKNILTINIDNDNPFVNQNKLLSALTEGVYTEYFKPIEVARVAPENVKSSTYGDHTKYVPIVEGDNAQVEYFIEAPTNDTIYVYLPSKYERKVNLWLNKEFLDYYYTGGNMTIQNLGKYDPGEEISLICTIDNDKNELIIKDQWFYYLDEAMFRAAYEKLAQHPFEVTSFKEDHIKGTITADQDGYMFTTINNEPGWTVWVDGVKTTTVTVAGALMAVPVSAGTHEIEMKFFPAGLALGMILTAVGIVIIVIMGIMEKKQEKRLLDRVYEEDPDDAEKELIPEAEVYEEAKTEKSDTTDENTENND